MISSMKWQLQVQNWNVESFKPDVMNPIRSRERDAGSIFLDFTM